MLRWILLIFAFALAALGSLTVVKSLNWAPWKLAVLAGEYGHWLMFAPLALAVVAWLSRGAHPVFALVTAAVCVSAAGLFLRPTIDATLIAATLPAKLAQQFGPVAIDRAAFSPAHYFESGPELARVETLSYADSLALDLYHPPRANPGQVFPCVIVVHGGGWDSGTRTEIAPFNHWLAGRGYVVAAIDYRLAPKFRWPAQRDDVHAAIAYLKSHSAALGIDPTRLVLFGRSAGGQIAEVIGYTLPDPALRGLIALYAPSDLVFGYVNTYEDDMLHSPALMRHYLGGTPESARENYESAGALGQVTRQAPPTLLLHGTIDALVWDRHSVRLDAKLTAQGVPHVFVPLPWATHAFEYNLTGPGGQLTRFAVEWFLAAVTK